jgi:hypothetical protein
MAPVQSDFDYGNDLTTGAPPAPAALHTPMGLKTDSSHVSPAKRKLFYREQLTGSAANNKRLCPPNFYQLNRQLILKRNAVLYLI